jgi:hypothetical protein
METVSFIRFQHTTSKLTCGIILRCI